MYAEERQQAIADLIAHQGRRSVADLAERYEVTTETVRRDLSVLERLGLVRRVHGGAVAAGSLRVIESGGGGGGGGGVVGVVGDATRAAEKEAIARAAVALLPAAGAVMLDASLTAVRLAALLPRDLRLDVITRAVPVASLLAGEQHVDLHLLPGRVRPTTQAAVGANTVTAIAGLRAETAFLGTNGLTLGHGLSTHDSEEAAAKQAMVRAARTVVVLADSSKVGAEALVSFASVEEIDVLVTDAGLAPGDHEALTASGVEVVIA